MSDESEMHVLLFFFASEIGLGFSPDINEVARIGLQPLGRAFLSAGNYATGREDISQGLKPDLCHF